MNKVKNTPMDKEALLRSYICVRQSLVRALQNKIIDEKEYSREAITFLEYLQNHKQDIKKQEEKVLYNIDKELDSLFLQIKQTWASGDVEITHILNTRKYDPEKGRIR